MTRVANRDPVTPGPGQDQGAGLLDLVRHPVLFRLVLVLCLAGMLLMPALWLIWVLVILVYPPVFFAGRYRLPYRLPLQHRGARQSGDGLLYLGNEETTGEQLWISNSDTRRHALVLGTTGSGKALPDDTPVLTEAGWAPIAGLSVGTTLIQPTGQRTRIRGIHPQGRLPGARLTLADGRSVVCSRDHLWPIRQCQGTGPAAVLDQSVMTTSDLAFLLAVNHLTDPGDAAGGGPCLPLVAPMPGLAGLPAPDLSMAMRIAAEGFRPEDCLIPLAGTAANRLAWFLRLLSERQRQHPIELTGCRIDVHARDIEDANGLQQMAWSLGGTALHLLTDEARIIRMAFPGQERLAPTVDPCARTLLALGNPIVSIEGCARIGTPVQTVPMTCIEVEAPDGLFVIESYLATHNTEMLFGMVSQALMWSSGFLFVDGKGTNEFHARVWSLAKRFGRQDDYRLLNFTGTGQPGGRASVFSPIQSNTLNPFSHGTSDQLMNLIVSLMGEAGVGSGMWHQRAMALVTSAVKALCEMRDAGDVLLNAQTIRDFLPLGIGVRKDLLGDRIINDVHELPRAVWDEMHGRGGMIELYLRALNDEFSDTSRSALKGFFDSLPGFDLARALNGDPQIGKAAEQHGFLTMQLTKPLGSLADDFGHIFATPIGDVDIEDVVLNRRILVVLLPALQKAPAEMQNCGRIVVAMLKMMMGKAAGTRLVGTRQSVVDARSTQSASPFIIVFDEAGYYMVKGIDIMMAQARSLGFMMVIAGQDMAAMQSLSPQIAETVAANARLTAAGATEDAQRTWQFLQRKFARMRIPLASGRDLKPGLLGPRLVERPGVNYVEQDRIRIDDLQKLAPGEFYFLMESRLVKARTFHVGTFWAPEISINKFLPVRGPRDRAPGLDQTDAIAFTDSLVQLATLFKDLATLHAILASCPFDPHDTYGAVLALAADMRTRQPVPGATMSPFHADMAAILTIAGPNEDLDHVSV